MASDEVNAWPEYVGADAEEVQKKLKAEGYNVQILTQGSPCTHDYRLDRVRLFVNNNNKIVQVPKTG